MFILFNFMYMSFEDEKKNSKFSGYAALIVGLALASNLSKIISHCFFLSNDIHLSTGLEDKMDFVTPEN